ncbi:MAG: endonuclease Q family protein, partial [Treponema sp.]|nr:endonuclease Q family protein [Treponema sp.]
MKIIADLHIHSRFSRATSKDLNPASLERSARIKGIDLIGSGDCTHPAWLAELGEQLEEAEEGLFTLKKEFRVSFDTSAAGFAAGEIANSNTAPRFA